jgi:hypothetical protein
MRASLTRNKSNVRAGDSTDKLFYWAIGGVVLTGLAANVYSTYTAEAPSLNTFLDLLTAHKTQYCDGTGALIRPSPGFIPFNCLDYNGYRIVEGPTTHIFEIRWEGSQRPGEYQLVKVAELSTDAMKKLFNLRNVDITYTVPEYPWP